MMGTSTHPNTNDRLAKLEQQFTEHIAQTAQNFKALSDKLDHKISNVTHTEGLQTELLKTLTDNIRRLETAISERAVVIADIERQQSARNETLKMMNARLEALEIKVTGSKILLATAAALGSGAATALMKLLGVG